MNDLARVEGEHRGTLCLVRVHGEIDLSNAHEVSAAIGIAMGQEARARGGSQRYHVPRSAGVALLLRLAERLRSRRRQIHLVVLADLPFAGSSISRVCRG
jgi:hypothetical protein